MKSLRRLRGERTTRLKHRMAAECFQRRAKNWFNQLPRGRLSGPRSLGVAAEPVVDALAISTEALGLRRDLDVDLPRRARQLQRPGVLGRPRQPQGARVVERDVGDAERAHVVVEHACRRRPAARAPPPTCPLASSVSAYSCGRRRDRDAPSAAPCCRRRATSCRRPARSCRRRWRPAICASSGSTSSLTPFCAWSSSFLASS